jgi:hypothetical protein
MATAGVRYRKAGKRGPRTTSENTTPDDSFAAITLIEFLSHRPFYLRVIYLHSSLGNAPALSNKRHCCGAPCTQIVPIAEHRLVEEASSSS